MDDDPTHRFDAPPPGTTIDPRMDYAEIPENEREPLFVAMQFENEELHALAAKLAAENAGLRATIDAAQALLARRVPTLSDRLRASR